jgi:hypothetical protein
VGTASASISPVTASACSAKSLLGASSGGIKNEAKPGGVSLIEGEISDASLHAQKPGAAFKAVIPIDFLVGAVFLRKGVAAPWENRSELVIWRMRGAERVVTACGLPHISIWRAVDDIEEYGHFCVSCGRAPSIFVPNHNLDGVANLGVFGKNGCLYCEPRPISLNSRGFGGEQREINEKKPHETNDSGGSGEPIEAHTDSDLPNGYPDLPFPECALGGAVFFLLGGWMSGMGFVRRPGSFGHVGGWVVMVAGGTVTVLSALPRVAQLVSP